MVNFSKVFVHAFGSIPDTGNIILYATEQDIYLPPF